MRVTIPGTPCIIKSLAEIETPDKSINVCFDSFARFADRKSTEKSELHQLLLLYSLLDISTTINGKIHIYWSMAGVLNECTTVPSGVIKNNFNSCISCLFLPMNTRQGFHQNVHYSKYGVANKNKG